MNRYTTNKLPDNYHEQNNATDAKSMTNQMSRCVADDKPDEQMCSNAKFMTNQTSGYEVRDKPDGWMGKSVTNQMSDCEVHEQQRGGDTMMRSS